MPWIFPDEAYHMNSKGIHPLKPMPLRNIYDPLPGGGSEAQTLFDNHDRKVALERVRMNKRKEEGMLGHRNTTARSQRYERPASRSSVPNGVFYGSPMDYAAESGLRGGVITTKEGREWLQKRLLQRREEYAQRASGDFSAGPPKSIEVLPFSEIDGLLQTVYTGFTAGSFSSAIADALNRLISAFIKAGAQLTASQVTMYAQAVSRLAETTRNYVGREDWGRDLGIGYEGKEKRFRAIDAINQTLKVIESVLREIARSINEPLNVRQQIMAKLGERLVQRQFQNLQPGWVDEERQRAIEARGEEIPEFGGPPQDIFPPIVEENLAGESAWPEPPIAPTGMGRRRYKRY